MKKIFTLALIISLALVSHGQVLKPTKRIGLINSKVFGITTIKERNIFLITGACFFTSGLVRGLNETLIYSYPAFQAKFPHANQMWWNPALSWNNSYPNSLLFQTAFIAPKDAKHTFDFVMNNLLYVTIPLQYFDRQNLVKLNVKYMVTRWAAHVGGHSLAFEIVHKGVFGL